MTSNVEKLYNLIADDSQAISTISGNTEQRYLRCSIVGQLPSPAQARGDDLRRNNDNNKSNNDPSDNNNDSSRGHNNNNDDEQQQQHTSNLKNNAWLYFINQLFKFIKFIQ